MSESNRAALRLLFVFWLPTCWDHFSLEFWFEFCGFDWPCLLLCSGGSLGFLCSGGSLGFSRGVLLSVLLSFNFPRRPFYHSLADVFLCRSICKPSLPSIPIWAEIPHATWSLIPRWSTLWLTKLGCLQIWTPLAVNSEILPKYFLLFSLLGRDHHDGTYFLYRYQFRLYIYVLLWKLCFSKVKAVQL